MSSCRLCAIGHSAADSDPPSFVNSPIIETENFVVLLGLGHLVDGYLLLVSRDHYPNFACLPEPLKIEALELSRRVRSILEEMYTAPFEYEHGAGKEHHKRGGCIVHAHVHFFPTKADCLTQLKTRVKLVEVPREAYTLEDVSGDNAYIYYRTQDGRYFFANVEVLPSQLIRQLLAVNLGKPETWDWREHPELEAANRAYRRLRSTFS